MTGKIETNADVTATPGDADNRPLFAMHFEDGGVEVDWYGNLHYTGNYKPNDAAKLLWLNMVSMAYPVMPLVLNMAKERAEALYDRLNMTAGLLTDRDELRDAMKRAIAEEILAAEERGRLLAMTSEAPTTSVN